MLPSTASNVRIMRYGYESAWFGSDAIKQSTTDAAEEFLDDLKGLREVRILLEDREMLLSLTYLFAGFA